MEFFIWSTTQCWLLLHVLVLLYILYSKSDEPSEATFWLLVVGLIPVAGLVLYCFFGITRIDRADGAIRSIRGRINDGRERLWGRELAKVERKLVEFAPDGEEASSDLNRMLDRIFPGSIPLCGNHVELLRDGTEAYPRMLEDIRAAKVAIRLQSFIFMSDEVGTQILDALEAKAREGVDVKILFDSFGSFKSYFSRFFRRCLFRKMPNFRILAFSPLNLFAPWKFQLRNHRKLLVIDGRVAYSGGINIADENEHCAKLPPNRYIHDLHCRITGPAVSQFSLSFFRDWAYTSRRKLHEITVSGDFAMPKHKGGVTLRVLGSGPGDCYGGTRSLFFSAAMLARKSLTIMTPYFAPGPGYVDMLVLASARGVDVKIIVPQKNNHFYVDLAARNFYPKLLCGGVRIFEKHGIFSHTKALLVDNEWGFMGSSNCDSRSFRLNFELDFCFDRGEFVASMREQVERELSQSSELSLYQEESHSAFYRFGTHVCALLTPIL